MKNLLFFLVLNCFCINTLSSQIVENSTAIDFTITDLNGQEHQLFEYLDQGKIVLVDIFGAWCPPCWDYVNSGALQKMNKIYGPDGKKDLVVLLIEGSGSSEDCIKGDPKCKKMTQGNWREIANLPIAADKNSKIMKDYKVLYYPTVFMVFPNQLVKEVKQVPFEELVKIKEQHKHYLVKKKNNVAAISHLLNELSCGEINPSFKFQNLGTSPLTSFDVDLYINDNLVSTKTWTGNADTYDVIDLRFESIEVKGEMEIKVVSRNPNSRKDRRKKNNIYKQKIYGPSHGKNNQLIFTITDVSEKNVVDIKILDPDGKIVLEILDRSLDENGFRIEADEIEFTQKGCYTFLIEDSLDDRAYNENLSVLIENKKFTYHTSREQFKKAEKNILKLEIPFIY